MQMNATKILPAYALMTLNIAVIFFMKTKFANSLQETAFLFVTILFAFIILKLAAGANKLVWTAMMLFLAMTLANNIYLFITTKYLPAFLLITMANLLGIIFFMMKKVEDAEKLKQAEKAEFESYESISRRIDNAIQQAKELTQNTTLKNKRIKNKKSQRNKK